MKILNRIIKTVFFGFLIASITLFSGVIYLNRNVEENYKVKNGETLEIESKIPITAVYKGQKLTRVSGGYTPGQEFEVDLKAFGLIPISSAKVEVVNDLQVAVLGTPFGMKIYTDGILVSDISAVNTANGSKNPAKDAGLKIGDYILSVDGKKVYTNEDLGYIVENSGGKKMQFEIMRNNTKVYLHFCGVKESNSNQYKIGVWAKDSTAGIGTLTFYSPTENIICGLGHGICEGDKGQLIKINSGEIVSAQIIAINKGKYGTPGQLKGRFKYETLGDIKLNCHQGVYSNFSGNLKFTDLTEIALKQQIKNGEAEILCTIDGETPQSYSCKIEIQKSNFNNATQNMLITVTDKKLLEKTGGIVQGMSGSPILQNGKLVGAVTHVLIDDPTKGYGIFAENMLETAQNVAQEQLKDAS